MQEAYQGRTPPGEWLGGGLAPGGAQGDGGVERARDRERRPGLADGELGGDPDDEGGVEAVEAPACAS